MKMIGGIALSCLRSALYGVVAVSILFTLFGTFNCNYRWWSAASTPWSRTNKPALTLYYHGMLQQAVAGNKGDVLLTGSASMKVLSSALQCSPVLDHNRSARQSPQRTLAVVIALRGGRFALGVKRYLG